jgi:protein-disulfide isomerase
MSCLIRIADAMQACRMRTGLLLSLASAALLLTVSAHAQFSAPSPGTAIHDASALKPPVGARVAIVEFADLECPACAYYNHLFKEAAATYKIPWVHHDFLIPGHIWSTAAAVNVRWFSIKSKTLGDEYRDLVFANQSSIYNLDQLRRFTEKFAQSHGIALPFAIDPQGKLAAEVKADSDLGVRTGITGTPTVFIVTAKSKGTPYIEVLRPYYQLYPIIDQAIADTTPAKAVPTKPPARKPAGK